MYRASEVGQDGCTRTLAVEGARSGRLGVRGPGRGAFTLIELLVVVAIIAILISILLPALSQARNQAKTSVCGSNMHQLMLSTIYYTDENGGGLPWIRGSSASGYRNAPYDQFHQILILFRYMKDLKLFVCPSAINENSVKSLYGQTLSNNNLGASHYFMRKSDDFYLSTAYTQNWWPQYDPNALAGDQEEFPDIYTEYWYNDFTSALVQNGNQEVLRDGANLPLPAMNGGRIDKIPFPQYAIPLAEFGWGLPVNKLRHSGTLNFGYLDGHVDRFAKKRFYDLNGRAAGASDRPQDLDPYGSRPFYAWGLTRNGRDFLQ